MTEMSGPSDGIERPAEIELVARLVRASGARAEPPREDYEYVLAAATAVFERKVARHRRSRAAWISALAACVVGAVAVLLWTAGPLGRSEPVSYPERLVGDVVVRAPGTTTWMPLAIGAGITARTALRTGASSGAALRLAGGPQLRLDASTEVSFDSTRRVTLERGAVYVDSGIPGGTRRDGIEIVTQHVTARDVGTRFEVRLTSELYRLRVREGRVLLDHAGGRSEGGAGEQLVIRASGRVERSRIAADDPGWHWIAAVATPPEIENQPLSLVLQWVTRETGRPIRYSSPGTEQLAAAAILHGSIRGLEPLPALETVLATSELSYQIMSDGSILITSQ